MPESSFSVSDIVQQLPQKLQRRFESLQGFVRAIIEEESAKSDVPIRLKDEDIQFIQLVVFIYALDSFFRAGSNAAREAATTFTEFGARGGFQVGQSIFTEDNENTRRGENLANELQLAISNSRISKLMTHASTLNSLVRDLLREMRG